MIKKIQLKNIASYDEVGIELDNLKKINFIYGSNGSGKTTLSNQIASSNNLGNSNCNISWENNEKLQTLIYNKQFRKDNFESATIEGVFTIGSATQEELKVIEQKQRELQELKEEGIKKKGSFEKIENDIAKLHKEAEEDFWESIYKFYEPNFKEAFRGFQYKKTFKEKLLQEFDKNIENVLTLDELTKNSSIIFGEVPVHIQKLIIPNYKDLINIQDNKIFSKKIVGKSDIDISDLILKLNINDWVNEGRSHLTDSTTCPFCQNETISTKFRKNLEDYFDESFLKDTQSIDSLHGKYKEFSTSLTSYFEKIIKDETNNKNSKLNLETFSINFKLLKEIFEQNILLITKKIKEPSKVIRLNSFNDTLQELISIISETNIEIINHNKIVANYKESRANLVNNIWTYIVKEHNDIIKRFSKKIHNFGQGVTSLNLQIKEKRKDYSNLNEEIKLLTKNVTSVQPAVDSINNTLKQFGFLSFSIIASSKQPKHYELQRENGVSAQTTLSEGEITFITFLYFMQLVKGSQIEDEVSQERVLIVDDPISSLDSTVLFVVSTLLKGVIHNIKLNVGNVKQLIVLTHNVYFHKEISYSNGRESNSNINSYWILRKNKNITNIQFYDSKNPISTSYELLWSELKNRDKTSNTSTQNVMRRIIENYFKILGKFKDDELIEKFPTVENQEICRSLLCWINDGSHCLTDDLFIELQYDSTEKYLEVFEQIFELTNHKSHYDMMMQD